MSKNREQQLNIGSNEYVSDEYLITLYGNNIEEYDKQDMVTNI